MRIFGILLGAGAVAMAGGQMLLTPIQPHTYPSPSGAFRLWVNPDEPYGDGGATYSLAIGTTKLWTKHLAFTLTGVKVGDDGKWAGLSTGNLVRNPKLRVVLADRAGNMLLDELHDQHPG
ncbi:MAG TPA: hypothetical protein VKT78_04905, partial [Fimbriimonadaceae bacterium]|nr:hypothetical protein [Fimbriimonadaceae bacterium]